MFARPILISILWALAFLQHDGPATPRKSEPPAPPTDQSSEDEDESASYPSAEDVLRTILEAKPKNEPILPTNTPIGSTAARRLLPEGTPITRRAGRLIKDGEWWTYVFESNNPDEPEAPMKVLPSFYLEQMASRAESESTGTVFIISGFVTVYRGENFILVQMAMTRAGSGNFSP